MDWYSLWVNTSDSSPRVRISSSSGCTCAPVFTPERFSSAWQRVALMDVAAAQEVFDAIGRLDRGLDGIQRGRRL